MTNYVIECGVSELTKDTGIAVKIVGSEGYAIKQGEKTYNVFCPKDLPKAKETVQSYIADSETKFTIDKKFENILTLASVHGKKIQLTIKLEDGKELKDYIHNNLPIQSVSLLQK